MRCRFRVPSPRSTLCALEGLACFVSMILLTLETNVQVRSSTRGKVGALKYRYHLLDMSCFTNYSIMDDLDVLGMTASYCSFEVLVAPVSCSILL